MKRRVFIAINLPGEIKEKLSSFQDEIDKPFSSFGDDFQPIRWTKKENLHITLDFLGYLTDEEINKVKKVLENISQKFSVFTIKLEKLCYGPREERIPRMVWVVGEKSQELSQIKENLDRELRKFISFQPENRDFVIHITLGRIRKWQWKVIPIDERPDIEKEISLKFKANSIDLMESKLKRGGAEYTILESYPLSK